jgi:hypothetical protein
MKQENNKDIVGNDGYRVTKEHCVVRLICMTILSYFLAAFAWFFTMYKRATFISTNQAQDSITPVAIFYEKWRSVGFVLPIMMAVIGWLAIRYMKKGIVFESVVGFGIVLSVFWAGFCVVGWLASFLPWVGALKAVGH